MDDQTKAIVAKVFAVAGAVGALFGLDLTTDLNLLQNEVVVGVGAVLGGYQVSKDIIAKVRKHIG